MSGDPQGRAGHRLGHRRRRGAALLLAPWLEPGRQLLAASRSACAAACRAEGADTLVMRGDVAQDAGALADAAVARWGRIDALVNNAGMSVFGDAAAWDALDPEVFQRIYAVNTVGSFQMVRACAPHLKASRGCIVNVSSIAGMLGIGSSVPYIASKGALNAMTLHLARAGAEVRVNAVCPGLITSRWFVQEWARRRRTSWRRTTSAMRRSSRGHAGRRGRRHRPGGRARTTTGELVLVDAGMHLGVRPAR